MVTSLQVKDAADAIKYKNEAQGDGSNGTPFVLNQSVNAIRNTTILHRTIADIRSVTGVSNAVSLANIVSTAGWLVANTDYSCQVIAIGLYNQDGNSTPVTITTPNDGLDTHVIRLTINKIYGATKYFIFFNTLAAGTNYWIGEITEAQRAGGGCRITSFNTVDTAGSNPSNTVEITGDLVNHTDNYVPLPISPTYNEINVGPTYSIDTFSPFYIVTAEDILTGGSLLPGTIYKWNVAPYNSLGRGQMVVGFGISTANDGNSTHRIRLTIPQVSGADGYDIAFKNYLARITEAQRAAGCTITGLGIVTGTSPGAGKVDLLIYNPSTNDSAYTGPTTTTYNLNTITPISCIGFSRLRLLFQKIISGLITTNAPIVVVAIFQQNQLSGDWHFLTSTNIVFGASTTAITELSNLIDAGTINVDGASNIVIAIVSANVLAINASLSIWAVLN